MEVKELRIGNLVNYLGKEYEVSAIGTRNDVIGLKGRPLTAMNLVNEIVLTEDWLIALGFEQSNENKDWMIKGNITLTKNGTSVCFGNCGQWVNLRINCKYVHQLQNLYFALTGKELELNE